ncbi:MAG TPA: hypothetical protein VN689_03590 [Burkholderiales bacterium]|nr:hypothetical protein [Burkholderiales bacterium]
MRRAFVAVGVLAWLAAPPISRGADQPAANPAPQLVAALLQAIRQPAADQFPSPESVVKFLLEQIQRQDLDEAAKAFPIVETYQRLDLASSARYLLIIEPNSTPFPQSPFRNLGRAMQPLGYFDSISLGLLGVDLTRVTTLKDRGSDAELKPIIDKCDRSRLANLQLGAITAKLPQPVKPDDARGTALHISARTQVEASLTAPDGKPAQLMCVVEKIDTNWRIVHCELQASP